MPTPTHSPIGVAVVGAGLLGTRHARVHHESPHATLVAVCDHELARAQGVAEPRGARAFADHRALFEALGPGGDGTLAAVSVATPDDAHRDVVCDALAAGLDVFVEKPLAMSLRDADAMIEAAERHGRLLVVNYSQRWLPEHRAVAARVTDGSLGDVTFVESHRWDAAWVPARMIAKWAHRTTPIHFMSSHDIDLVVHWLDDRVRRVTAVVRRERDAVADDPARRLPGRRRLQPLQRTMLDHRSRTRPLVACASARDTAARWRLREKHPAHDAIHRGTRGTVATLPHRSCAWPAAP